MSGESGFTAADVERLVQSAVEQGLPRHVEDPETCRTVATLLRGAAAPTSRRGGVDQ